MTTLHGPTMTTLRSMRKGHVTTALHGIRKTAHHGIWKNPLHGIWRPALRATTLLALAGLAGTSAAHAASQPAPRHAAHVASPAFLTQMAHALGRMHRYEVVTRGVGAGASVTSTTIVVRHGHTTRLFVTALTQRAGQTSRQEAVFTGTHLCLRTDTSGAWLCRAERSSTLTRMYTTSAAQLAKSFGPDQRYVPVGRQTRQGQPCTGYRTSLSSRSLHGQVTLWLAQATRLPVEEDAVSTLVLHTGASPLVVHTSQRWSRWNDPHLTIPAVPAS